MTRSTNIRIKFPGKKADILNLRVEGLGLSVRAYNTLMMAGLGTVGEVVSLRLDQVGKVRLMSRKSAKEIEGKIHSLGLLFADETKEGLSFEIALMWLKKGCKVKRRGQEDDQAISIADKSLVPLEDMTHDDWMVVCDKKGKEKEGIQKG